MKVRLLLIFLCVFVAQATMAAPVRDSASKVKQERSFEPLTFKTPLPAPPKDEGGMGPSLRSKDATQQPALGMGAALLAVVISFVNNNDHTPPDDGGLSPSLYYYSILFGAIISPNAP